MPPTADTTAAAAIATGLRADAVALDRAIARTQEILRRLRARQEALCREAETEIALAAAEIDRSRRIVPADEDEAMTALHGGRPDDPDYCSR